MATLKQIIKKIPGKCVVTFYIQLSNGKMLSTRLRVFGNKDIFEVTIPNEVERILKNRIIISNERDFKQRVSNMLLDGMVAVKKSGGFIRAPRLVLIMKRGLLQGISEIVIEVKAALFESDAFMRTFFR